MSALVDYLDKRIAEDLGILPEQVTTELIHELRKKSYKDGEFGMRAALQNADLTKDPKKRELWQQLEESCQNKMRKWAQEYLKNGATPCTR